ncbi:MAG TPA: rod shape-determining protein RodA [Verrucomicrobiae bacterium]|jgi:rod shape determining protein RodA|nr:rod shape-determining protein RodA [Verrucomicrobiae bacterium]
MIGLNQNDKKSGFDWPLLGAALCLAILGVLFIYSATGGREAMKGVLWWRQTYFHQIIWFTLGALAAGAICAVDYSSLTRWSTVIYWLAIGALLVVLAVGVTRLGGRRWIMLPGNFSLQPSEFAKIAFILMMAGFLSRPLEELRTRKIFWQALGLAALPFILILKEPDLGSAMVFLPIGLTMMFVAGVPGRYIARLVAGLGVLAILLVATVLFAPNLKFIKSYQKDRLVTYFGGDLALRKVAPDERKAVEKELRDKSYNVEQALISVGSGGLSGKGWRQGTQYALGFLPQAGAHNDFIFSVIAEEEGFVGSVVILTLYAALLFSGIKIASQARDRLGQLLAAGVVTLLFCHVFINIGMNIRLMPVTGIPLPLLSYGGSSVICSLIAIGILHNVHIYRRSY